jgi:hypothetical protein
VERSGKDLVADYLVRDHGFYKYSMADPIKDIAQIMFGWSRSQLYGPDKDNIDPITGIKPRDFFIWFGTQIAQYDIYSIFKDCKIPSRTIWTQHMTRVIKDQKHGNIIIPDIRFKHEADALLAAGGQLICLRRPSKETTEQLAKYDLDMLFQRSDIPQLVNSGTSDELFCKISNLLNKSKTNVWSDSHSNHGPDMSNISLFI